MCCRGGGRGVRSVVVPDHDGRVEVGALLATRGSVVVDVSRGPRRRHRQAGCSGMRGSLGSSGSSGRSGGRLTGNL